ncbi:MAG: hypothetical protein CUN54_04550 [Phototrophicales bacterium]|nr:MAG: hypothetical protein CUN54_04550 [Phototrophicales bacterium]
MTENYDYLFIGHATADLTEEGRRLGGTVSYGARTVHAFGKRVALLTSAATNEPLLDELRPFADVRSLPAEATSTFENIYDASGKRKQYIRSVAAKISADDIPAEWLSIPLVHLAPLTDEVDPQIAHQFKDATVLLTLQGWLRRWDADGLVHFKRWFDADVLRSIDIVVYSEEDIVEAPDLEQAFAEHVEHLIITRAEKGGTYYHNGEAVDYDTPQVEVVHATGAGDIFAAAVLTCLPMFDGDMLKSIRVAARLGAISVTRFALDGTPSPEEVQQAIAEVE